MKQMSTVNLDMYEFGGLNDNKKITATFAHYEVSNHHGELYITAVLKEGEIPKVNEGYRINGQQLWISLCRLHDKLMGKAEHEILFAIIAWCKKHVHPYYFLGDPYIVFDEEQKTNADFWDVNVNRLEIYEFTADRFMKDLVQLYTHTQVMIAFHHIIKRLELDSKMRKTIEKIPELKDIFYMERKEQLLKIRAYTAKAIPQFPMELVVDATGTFQIIPTFRSVFDVAYYAMAQYVSSSPDYPLHWGGRTGIAYCKSCGNIFIKNGNRQKYCADPECKKERDRRKSKGYYYRKIQQGKGGEKRTSNLNK